MVTIYWAGDSTVRQNSMATYPQTGIGQTFGRFTDHTRVCICDTAENGASAKSFIREGRLAAIEESIRPGDFLFIQFGHNDEKDNDPARYASPEGEFQELLMRFADVARSHSATPVFITPVTRRLRHDPKAAWRHDRWAEAYRSLGLQQGIAVIDLTAMSEALVDSLSDEASCELYMNFGPGLYPNFPSGSKDNTHLRPAGAHAFGRLIARALLDLQGPYAGLLDPEVVPVLREEAFHETFTQAGE